MAGAFKVTRLFFDKAAVRKSMDKKTHKVLSKFGAFVRRGAQTSMRPGKKSSPPGTPPRSRGTRLLRKLIEFHYDPVNKVVVIGPYRLGRTAAQHVPRTHEAGGVIRRTGKDGKQRTDRYPPRPFMKPAFDTNIVWVPAEYRRV